MLADVVLAAALGPGWATGDSARIARGKETYEVACAACHGRDGRGNPEWESDVRPIEFSDCGTTAEPTELWTGIVKHGGQSSGLSSVMPAYDEAYDDDEIGAVVAYIRTFCAGADAYPPGDLNFRRLLKTGKAFPEQEVVLRLSHGHEKGSRETEVEAVYESRIGPRFQYELTLPVRAQASAGAGRGVADVEVEAKYVLGFDVRRLDIFSAGVGLVLPTGSEAKGLGDGTAFLSPFLAFGKGLGSSRTLLQAKAGVEIPTDSRRASTRLPYAVGLSQVLGTSPRGFAPAIELSGTYDARTKEHEYAAWIEVSKPLNKLGHVIASVGTRIPIRPKGESYRIEAYLLWDFGDGPLWIGW
jgi:mono/diheme cytochrome c family protein